MVTIDGRVHGPSAAPGGTAPVAGRALRRPARTRVGGLGTVFALLLGVAVYGLPATPAGADETGLQAARERARAAAAELTATETRLDQLEVDIQHAQVTLETTRATYDEVAVAVRAHLVERYVRAGGTDPLVSGDLNVQARADALSRLATRKAGDRSEELRALRQQLDGQLRSLRDQDKAAARTRTELAGVQKALYAELDRLQEIDARRREEERQAETARRQAAAAGEVAAAATGAENPAGSGGGGRTDSSYRPIVPANWLCPITGAYAYDDTWGASRSGGRWHRGTDMFADYGTPVVAVVGGNAVDYGWDNAGGNGVFLLGDDGNRYYYAHLDDFADLGRVEQGDVVGYVGDSGNATGTPHLHFELHPGGSGWTNPYPTLVRYC